MVRFWIVTGIMAGAGFALWFVTKAGARMRDWTGHLLVLGLGRFGRGRGVVGARSCAQRARTCE